MESLLNPHSPENKGVLIANKLIKKVGMDQAGNKKITFHNRRIYIGKWEQGFKIVFKLVHEPDGGSPVFYKVERNILHTTALHLTRETAEVLMVELAEYMGFAVVVKDE